MPAESPIAEQGNRKSILLLKAFCPFPPDCGSNILTLNLLRELGTELEVTLLTRRPECEREARSALESMCKEVVFCDPPNLRTPLTRAAYAAATRIRCMASGKPIAARYAELAFGAPLRGLLAARRFDLVQIEYWNLAGLAPMLPCNTPRCILLHDVQPEVFRREAALRRGSRMARRLRRDAARAERFERQCLPEFDHVLTVTEPDAAHYRGILEDRVPVQWLPTLYDTASTPQLPDPGGVDLVFVGAMTHRPNCDAVAYFATEVLPLIARDAPEARFMVVGRNPPDSVRRLASERVVVTGAVDAVQPYLRRAAVYVAPLRFGGGVKIKILEALACGKALVTTRVGAEGIAIEHEQDCLIADSAPAFAAAVIRLLRDVDLRVRLGASGRAAVAAAHGFESAGPRVRAIYRAMLNKETT